MPTSRYKRVGIQDVALAAGVSKSTVSRVLNDNGYPVKQELRQRILRAARELDYTPNVLGRMLQSNSNQEIGILIPTIENPFYTQIVMGLENEARQCGYGVLLCNTLRSSKIETECLRSLFEKRVAGVALSSVSDEHAELRSLQKKGLRLVVIDQNLADVTPCAQVGFDYLRAGVLAAEHLIDSGRRRIAFLSSPLSKHSRRELLEGIRLGHTLRGMTLYPENVLIDEAQEESAEDNYDLECGRRLAVRLLAMHDRPDGVFISNDMIAIGALSMFAQKGVAVPGDLSVIGFDNIPMSSVISPSLTTIEQPAREIGRLACRMLIDLLEGKTDGPFSIMLNPKLVERLSVRREADFSNKTEHPSERII